MTGLFVARNPFGAVYSRVIAVALPIVMTLAIASCARLSDDGGMIAVQDIAHNVLGKDVIAIRSDEDSLLVAERVHRLLQKPLSEQAAVQVALLNNKELQAAYAELGIEEAKRVRDSLPPTPTFSVSYVAGAGGFELERQVALGIVGLATLPARSAIAADRFHQAQLQAALETLRIALETRRAWIKAVSARSVANYLVQAQSSARTASEFSQRLGQSGAINKLDQARNQVFFAEVSTQLAAARQRALAERENLIRLMGLWGEDLSFTLPAELPQLPSRAHSNAAVETAAVNYRIDVQIARIELDAVAKSYGLTQATRFINVLDASGSSKRQREPGSSAFTERGGAVVLQIPWFDFGAANLREAEQRYLQAYNRLVAKAINARSEARESYQAYRATFDIARHYQTEVLPLRKVISDESVLRYNAMQIDVFSLLTEARSRINSISASVDAAKEFWLADTALGGAILGGGTASSTSPHTAPMETANE